MLQKRIFTFFCFGALLALLAASLPISSSAALSGGPDGFGYTYDDTFPYSWSPGSIKSGVTGDDATSALVNIGFSFPFYENSYTQLYFSTNGLISFGIEDTLFTSRPIPTPNFGDNFIAPFWDDLTVGTPGNPDNAGAIYTLQGGVTPDRYFIVEWRNVTERLDSTAFSFEAILYENGDVVLQYASLPPSFSSDGSTLGIENSTGTDGLQYFHGTSGLAPAPKAIRFSRPLNPVRRVYLPLVLR